MNTFLLTQTATQFYNSGLVEIFLLLKHGKNVNSFKVWHIFLMHIFSLHISDWLIIKILKPHDYFSIFTLQLLKM